LLKLYKIDYYQYMNLIHICSIFYNISRLQKLLVNAIQMSIVICMIALIQRVSSASVEVKHKNVAEISSGLLALIGVQRGDNETKADKLLQKLLNYRVFEDDQGRMNLGLVAIDGGLLLVPQFTLAADTSSGLRPGFSSAAAPHEGQHLFEYLVAKAQGNFKHVCSGVFGADMKVSLVNEGPATFWLEV